MSNLFTSSKPDNWTVPRPHRDASLRHMKCGPVRAMESDKPSLLSRLLGRTLP